MPVRAVVIGTDHINTLGVVRSLGEASINVDLLVLHEKSSKSWVTKSRYISKVKYCGFNDCDIINGLLDLAEGNKDKLFLFPCGDYPALIVDKYRNELAKDYFVPGVLNGKVSLKKLMNKSFMITKALEAGFLAPKTKVCDFSTITKGQINELCYYFADSYPLLIRSIGVCSNFNKYMMINTQSQLIALFDKNTQGEAIIQEYIDKDEEIGIQGVGCRDCNAEPIITNVIHKIRTSVISQGSTTFATIVPANSNEPILECKKFIQDNCYSGIFDIEFLRKGSKYYFIECNFRNGAYGYAYTVANHNLPMIWITGQDKSNDDLERDFYLMNEFNDIKHIRDKNVNFVTWIKQFLKSDIHLTINKNDLKPFFYRLLYH